MKIKDDLEEISTDDFWYDIFDGGYIKPREVCDSLEDAKRVEEAIETLKEFRESLEGYVQYV